MTKTTPGYVVLITPPDAKNRTAEENVEYARRHRRLAVRRSDPMGGTKVEEVYPRGGNAAKWSIWKTRAGAVAALEDLKNCGRNTVEVMPADVVNHPGFFMTDAEWEVDTARYLTKRAAEKIEAAREQIELWTETLTKRAARLDAAEAALAEERAEDAAEAQANADAEIVDRVIGDAYRAAPGQRRQNFIDQLVEYGNAGALTTREETARLVCHLIRKHRITMPDFLALDEKPGRWGYKNETGRVPGEWHCYLRQVRNNPDSNIFNDIAQVMAEEK